MAQNNPEQEPSIEEILASIRQIISDDDEEETVAEPEPEPAPKPKAKAKPAPEPVPEPELEEYEDVEEDDEVLELTDKLDQPDEDDEDDFEPEPPRVEIDLQDSDDYNDDDDIEDDDDSLLTDSAQHAVFEGISALASRTALDRKGTGATTIEDIVREMMKPMLREWLDVHLPPLIEKIVQRELRKVARRAMEDEE